MSTTQAPGTGAGSDARGSEPLSSLQLPPALSAALREHQVSALHFLWRRLVDDGVLRMAARTYGSTLEQRALLYQEVYGCIVGHSMGLGKTLTALAFLLLLQAQIMLMTMKKQQARSGKPRQDDSTCPALRVIVLCPKSCVRHWLDSATEWVRPELFGRVSLPFYAPSTVPAKKLESILQTFHANGGVLVLGYEEYTRLAASLVQRPSSSDWNGQRQCSFLDGVRQRLPLRPVVRYIDVLESADVVVLDEAHRLRRASSVLVQTLRKHLRNVQVRVALTGTPLQNHLEEYNVMQSTVTGSDLDSHQFNKYFVSPIQLGQCSDSSYQQFSEMQRCVAALRRYFATTVHRCGPEELERVLPPRKEFVFFFALAEKQEVAYRALLKRFREAYPEAELTGTALVLHHEASHVCLHPSLARTAKATRTAKSPAVAEERARAAAAQGQRASRSGAKGRKPTVTSETQSFSKTPSPAVEVADGVGVDSDSADEDGDEKAEGDAGEAGGAAGQSVDLADSPKLLFALRLIEHITNVLNEKVVVFSLYLSHLQLTQLLLRQRLDPTRHDPPNIFSGDASEAQRAAFTADFQTNPRRRVLLCSVRAGGVGVNLNAANHCIMLDVSWNPADDTQATYRVFRFGQRRPVTIYRLSTRGTTEQVVFGYALHKTWLHRKIADLTDPTRQERHMKRSYFTYPCQVTIDDGAPPDIDQGDKASRSAEETHEVSPARTAFFVDICEKECPEAARVLRADPALQHSLYSVVHRSFLLRDDSAEAIAEMESRFRQVQQQRQARMPIALTDEDESLLAHPRGDTARKGAEAPYSPLEECEAALVDAARTAANHIIWHVVQRRHDAGLLDAECDTTAVVRETDRTVCALLQPLLAVPRHTGAASFTFQNMEATQAPVLPASPLTHLAEVLVYAYHEGARHTVTTLLSQSSFTKLRTYLTSRIPREAIAASAKRSRRSTLTHGVLEDALLYRPHELLSRVDAVEQTYLATEMGFVRPLVQQCFFLGLQNCLARLQSSDPDGADTNLSNSVRTLLKSYFCEWPVRRCRVSAAMAEGSDDSNSEDELGAVDDAAAQFSRSQAEAASWRLDVLVPHLADALERCLNDLWPNGSGFKLPPVCMDVAREEQRVSKVYRAADSVAANTGVVGPAEAASVLGMARSQVQRSRFTCPRCRNAILERSGDTTLGCSLCHYNAEFALRNDPRCRQPMTLFQLSFACNLLDALSISKSFSTTFSPAACRGVWEALLHLRAGQPMFHFVERSATDGVDLLLAECPSTYVQLLGVQSGVGQDRELLRRMLLANASLVWSEGLRRHVREGLATCFRNLIGPSSLSSFASMPLMGVILSLHLAARHEGLTLAAELLEGEQASNVCTASSTGGRRRALLRFACDCLVKLLYVEKLLEHCREPPNPEPTADTAANGGQEDKAAGGGGFSDLEDLSLPSSSRSRSPPTSPPRSALSSLVRRPSPSSSSSSSSSPSAPPKRPERKRVKTEALPPVRHSDSSSWHSSSRSSSVGSRYSSDRESFVDASRGEASRSNAREADAPWWFGAADEEEVKTAEQLEGEATLEQRSAQYWVAHCEVYGTRSVETLTVFVEDEELGMTILPPPPPLFWVSHLMKASKDGRTVLEVIDMFLEKVLALSQKTRLIMDV